MSKVLLDVRNLKLYFRTRSGPVQAVDNVSFQLEEGKTLAVVGESGCGKTSLTKAILRLLPEMSKPMRVKSSSKAKTL